MKSIIVPNEELFRSVLGLIELGRDVKITITGSSMEPFIMEGEGLILSKVSIDDIKLGDVVLGFYKHSYVLHRVIRRASGCVYLAGDNNLKQIEKIQESCIYAIGKEVIRDDKKVDLRGFCNRWKGMIWYILRPFRRLFVK